MLLLPWLLLLLLLGWALLLLLPWLLLLLLLLVETGLTAPFLTPAAFHLETLKLRLVQCYYGPGSVVMGIKGDECEPFVGEYPHFCHRAVWRKRLLHQLLADA